MLNQYPDVTVIKDNLGLTHYLIGSDTSFKDAVNSRAQAKLAGAKEATIMAFNDGNYVSFNKSGVVYKIQLGVFRNIPDPKFMNTFKQFKDGSVSKDNAGLSHYLVGAYPDFQSALAANDKANQGGVKDSFVVAYYNGNKISIPEIMKLP
jgi:hypothetical protein